MLQFLVRRHNRHGIEHLLRKWAGGVAERVRLVPYEELHRISGFSPGVLVFLDLDLLDAQQREIASRIATAIEPHRDRLRILNDPRRVALRLELLTRLHDAGVNEFRSLPAEGDRPELRFPVFLRQRDRHSGALTPLLEDWPEVERALLAKRLLGYSPTDLLIIEYCDAREEDGIFHKYSALCIEGRVLPRYRNSGFHWHVKTGYTSLDEIVREREYVRSNPHAEWIRGIFDLGSIDYGRVDYGLVDGRPQAWEVNLNPSFGRRWWQRGSGFLAGEWRRQKEDAKQHFFGALVSQLDQLSREVGESDDIIPLGIDRRSLRALRAGYGVAARDLFHRLLAAKMQPFASVGRVLGASADRAAGWWIG